MTTGAFSASDVRKTAVPGTRYGGRRSISSRKRSRGSPLCRMIPLRTLRPVFHVVINVNIDSAIATGTHPPRAIFKVFALRNARSNERKNADRPTTRHVGQFQ